MSRLTHHAKRRMEERGNITHDWDAKRNADRAFRDGIRHSETMGEVHKWLDGKFLCKRNASHMRIYRGYLYIFNHQTLITVLELPIRIKKALPDCVSKETYKRYVTFQNNKDQWKSAKKVIRNSMRARAEAKARKAAFWNRVLISDVEDALPSLPAKIHGIHFDENGITVFFIPDHNERPNLTALVDYLKDSYGYHYVYLKHMRDDNGKLMFGMYEDPYASEIVYSSEEKKAVATLADLLNDIVLQE